MIGAILVPVDDSPQADAALEYALEEFPEASITALHVVHVPEGYWSAFIESEEAAPRIEAAREDAQDVLDSAAERASAVDRELDTEVKIGEPAREIVEYAIETDVDQIVIGSHGRTGTDRLLFGSVSEKVVRTAPMTVVVVREGGRNR